MITLTNIIDVSKKVTLPDDLFFTNEFDQPTVRQQKKTTISGAMIVQRGQTFKGRKIALSGTESVAWIKRRDVLKVRDMANTAINEKYTLHLGGVDIVVIFDYDTQPFYAKPVIECSDSNDESWYTFEINLLTV